MSAENLDLLKSSLILMVSGMGMTFLFLIVQVIFTNLSSKWTAKFAYLLPEPAPKKVPKPAAPAKPKAVAEPEAEDTAVVAAIIAAIQHYQG